MITASPSQSSRRCFQASSLSTRSWLVLLTVVTITVGFFSWRANVQTTDWTTVQLEVAQPHQLEVQNGIAQHVLPTARVQLDFQPACYPPYPAIPQPPSSSFYNARFPYGRYRRGFNSRTRFGVRANPLTGTVLPRPANSEFGERPTPQTLKVFGVGLSRTGTSSLADALVLLGLRVVHFDHDLLPFLPSEMPFNFEGFYDDFDAALDIPTAAYYEELLHFYPNALFILTDRDAEGWYRSWSEYLAILRETILPPGAVETVDVRLLHKHVYGTELPEHDTWVRSFNAHNENVRATIPSAQLLHLTREDIQSDPFGRICAFLRLDPEDCSKDPYPKANSLAQVSSELRQQHSLTASAEAKQQVKWYRPHAPTNTRPKFAVVTFMTSEQEQRHYNRNYLSPDLFLEWCRSIRANISSESTAKSGLGSSSSSFDVVLLTLGPLAASSLPILSSCFDRILPCTTLGPAPRSVVDSEDQRRSRMKLWMWSLVEYERIVAVEVEHGGAAAISNLDQLFFREFYEKQRERAPEIAEARQIPPEGPCASPREGPLPVYALASHEFTSSSLPGRSSSSATHPPLLTSLLSIAPSLQTIIDLQRLSLIGDWNGAEGGWNGWGTIHLERPPLASEWTSGTQRLPSLAASGSPLTAPDWSFDCSSADSGLLLYYFYLLYHQGGLLDNVDMNSGGKYRR